MPKNIIKEGSWKNAPYVLSSSTFPSKSHVLSINRDEVTLFQVRAIRYDLRIFGLVSLDTSFVRPLCALWGAGRSRPQWPHCRLTWPHDITADDDNKMNTALLPNYILMLKHKHSRGKPLPFGPAVSNIKLKT